MLSWFDIAYATLNIFVILYCFKNYFSSKKKPFQLFTLGFTCLLISDFIWVFSFIPWISEIPTIYGYIRLAAYTLFILFILRALQLFHSNQQVSKSG